MYLYNNKVKIKCLSANHSVKLNTVCLFSQSMLSTYSAKPQECWRNKVAAIYLVTTLSAKGQTARHGATQINELVNITEFYQNHILPELQSNDGMFTHMI